MTNDCPLPAGALRAQIAAATEEMLCACRAMSEQRKLPRGTTLLEQGERPVAVFALTAGLVRFVHDDDSGVRKVLGIRSALRPMGTLAACASLPMPYRVEAVTPCCVQRIPAAVFKKRLDREPSFCLLVMALHTLKALEYLHGSTGVEDSARDRVTRVLEAFGVIEGTPEGTTWIRITLSLTQEELAALAGVAPETFSRVLRQLELDGVAERGRGWIRIKPKLSSIDGDQVLMRSVDSGSPSR
jgi:CRP-like cAMP-binding protein